MKSDYLKSKIIVNVLDLIDGKNTKEAIKSDLNTFAKYYHIKLKKVSKISLKIALKAFVLNEKGYNETINKLYNSI